jgi:uncharacterized membrane protein YhhN
MNTRTKILSLAYFLTGSAFMVFQNGDTILPVLIIKSLIIPILMILFIVNLKLFLNRLNLIMLAGLFFSWAGDMVLEFEGLFIPGLGCFLLAHVMYLVVFFKTPGRNVIFQKRWYLLIPVILSGAGLILYLYNDLADMRIPVIIYSIVILTMLTGAINRLEKVNLISYYLVLTGAILFVISDSAIAINKFSHHFESSGIVVMTTYIIAQYLIVSGFIKQSKR